jgi:hypothetical protein
MSEEQTAEHWVDYRSVDGDRVPVLITEQEGFPDHADIEDLGPNQRLAGYSDSEGRAVYVLADLPEHQRVHTLAHEVMHWWLQEYMGLDGHHPEDQCSMLGRALMHLCQRSPKLVEALSRGQVVAVHD